MNEIRRPSDDAHARRIAPPPYVGVIAALLLLLLTGCGSAQADTANGKLRIVTTTGQIADIVRTAFGVPDTDAAEIIAVVESLRAEKLVV